MAQQLTRGESLAVQGAAISGVILTRLLPDLVLGPLAGALADRLDRRTTVVVGELLALTLYLSIAVTYEDRKSTRLNSSHANISYAVFCLKKNTPCHSSIRLN